ncbi:MAG: glycosyltransferase family 9 protein [Desulfobulbaceae bacterium]
MDGGPFWGCWNRLPFARRNDITSSWLRREDEQLPDRELCWQTVRRWLLLRALGQRRHVRSAIPPESVRILWLHQTDHLGDSLMRLSSVRLLQGRAVDLLASAKAAALFEEGGVFRRIYCLDRDDAAAAGNPYDLVILDALQTRPLMTKQRLFRATPFVSQNDFFHFCRDDYNLTLFSWYRMAHLLGMALPELEKQARLTMEYRSVPPDLLQKLEIREGAVGIALGGREAYRIYRAWDRVADLLLREFPDLPLVLLGTENAGELAQRIVAAHPLARIVNCVERLSLKESAAVIAGCRLLLCADGGLLHVANATATPTVGLFAQEFPDLRYVPADRFRALRGEEDVNEINPERVAREAGPALAGEFEPWRVMAGPGGAQARWN